MHYLLLFFSLGLLVLFLPPLYSNIFDPALNWKDLLIYTIAGAITYGIIWLVGNRLSKKYIKLLENFTVGDDEEFYKNKGLYRRYGFLIINLLPTLIYLLGLSMYAAATLVLYALILISNASRVPVWLIFGLGAIGLGTAAGFVLSFYYLLFPPSYKALGISLSKHAEPDLWRLVIDVAKKLHIRPVDEIIITPDPGIGVYQKGWLFSVLFGSGKKMLEIGLPSITKLSQDEFSAILAHEYGHFSHKDTRWGAFTHSMGNALLTAYRYTPGLHTQTDSDRLRGILALNPAHYILRLFVKLYFKVTSGFSQIQEVKADIDAINLFGSKAFSDGLYKVSTNDYIFDGWMSMAIQQQLKNGKQLTNLSDYLGRVIHNLDTKDKNAVEEKLLVNTETNDYNSHPALKIRMEYAKQLNVAADHKNVSLEKVFTNWDKLAEEVTDLYYARIYERIKQYVAAQQQAEQAEETTPEPAKQVAHDQLPVWNEEEYINSGDQYEYDRTHRKVK